jgi:outer membrane receptor protein involved in Fe transport
MKSALYNVCLYTTILLLAMFQMQVTQAQNQSVISGKVTDKTTGNAMPGVTVSIKGATAGAITDANGNYRITTTHALPITLVFSNVGYRPTELHITSAGSNQNITLESTEILGMEVVVAASRVAESILESPVSIEKLNTVAIREVPTLSFYDALPNLKGVESSMQSFTFRSITTRGFNGNGNTRFNQLMDGMDGQAPGLNFAVGNIVGISDLDVESVELLPGASSALYGAGGMNGTLLMNSKNPYDYQGLSLQLRAGMNHIGHVQRSSTGFIPDISARYAKAIGKFGFKVNASYLTANDWEAQDYRNFDRNTQMVKPGASHADDPNYDGVNVYGDEINGNMQDVMNGVLQAGTAGYVKQYHDATGTNPTQQQINTFLATNPQTQPFYVGKANNLIPNTAVSRTGYDEKDMVDYNARSVKISAALHYRFTDNLEGILQGNWGNGTTVYTGTDRYSLRNFILGQYKAELKGKNFFLRAYTTQERSGEAYNATALASLMNETWKDSRTQWFPEYVGNFVGAKLAGVSDAQAHAAARAAADQGRLQPGTTAFDNVKDEIAHRYIGFGPGRNGAKFNDKSNLYHYEGMYNFTSHIKVFELLAGASYRRNSLHSNGTIFDDADKGISIDEYGAYLQASKKVINDRLKLTGSLRYDKNENFEGRFTPRLSAVVTVAPENNIRLSYQTGFRIPTNQDQYIDLPIRAGVQLIGALPTLLNKYDLYNNKGYTQESVQKFQTTGNPADLKQYTFATFKPERVKAYEIGYRGLIANKLLIDGYYYYNIYNDFISPLVIIQSSDGTPMGLANNRAFATNVNDPTVVKTQGWALGLDYVQKNWTFGGNVSYNSIIKKTSELENDFNTPKVRFSLNTGNKNVYKNIGFNIMYRWQDSYYWYSTFGAGNIPAFSTLDAQINYKVPAAKAMVKLGGSNILNKYYTTSWGNPAVGAVYYISLTFDELFK